MSKFNLRGKMTVTVHQARNLSNKELVGKMDPFCVIKLSGSKDEKFKTKIAQDQHQNPVWEQSYIFNLEGKEELLHANVWNQATLGDDHIGRLDLTLDAFDLSGKPRWYQLKDKSNFSKQTGELSLSIVFEGSGLPAGSVGFTTHEARIHPPAAAAAAPVSPPVIAAQQAPAPSPVATVAPPVVQQQQQFHSQQPNYNQPPQQQQQQQPQYGSGYPGQAPPQQQQFQQQQPQYAPQQPAYQPPQQPMYQQPPQPVYQQAPMQPVYASAAPVYQQPAAVVYQSQPVQFQPAAVVYQTQPAVVYQQQPQQRPGGQLIGYWPNGQPRYA